MRVLSFSIVENKKKKRPFKLMTKFVSLNSDLRKVEIRICTMGMVLGLKNIGTQGVSMIHLPKRLVEYILL